MADPPQLENEMEKTFKVPLAGTSIFVMDNGRVVLFGYTFSIKAARAYLQALTQAIAAAELASVERAE